MNPALPLLLSVMLSNNGTATESCDLPSTLAKEIDSYGPVVRRILSAFDYGPQSGTTYHALAEFADHFGHRQVGSENLEAAIDALVAALRVAGVDRVETEPVETPVWQRGRELAVLVTPRHVPLDVLGLGGSVATPPGGITAPVLVVHSFEELESRSAENHHVIVRDAVVEVSEDFDHLGFFNVHPSLSTGAYSIFAAIENAAAAAEIPPDDLRVSSRAP